MKSQKLLIMMSATLVSFSVYAAHDFNSVFRGIGDTACRGANHVWHVEAPDDYWVGTFCNEDNSKCGISSEFLAVDDSKFCKARSECSDGQFVKFDIPVQCETVPAQEKNKSSATIRMKVESAAKKILKE